MRRIGKQWILSGILLIAWIPWGIMCLPGNLPWDAGTGIAWFLGLDRSNVNNPYFQNLLFGSFYSIGQGLGFPALGICIYCWLQMILEAILMGHIVAYLSDRWAGKAAYGLIAFYGLLPVFPIYAFMMGKDSNIAIGILWFVFLLLRSAGEREGFWSRKSNVAGIAAMPAVLSLLRNFAGWVPLIIVVVLLLRWRKKAGIIPAVISAAVMIFVSMIVPRIAGIPAAEIKEEMCMPLQTAAYYVQQHPEEVTPEERETIESVVDWEIFTESYNPNIADYIKDPSHFTPETRGKFLAMWFGMLRKHPGTILEGWRQSIWIYFDFSAQSPIKSHVFLGVGGINPEMQEPLGLTMRPAGNYTAGRIWSKAITLPVIRQLQCIGLYSWLALGMALAGLILKRLRKFVPCCLMLLMVLGACMLSPVNGYYRYAYPMILSVPVVFTGMLGCFMKERRVSK